MTRLMGNILESLCSLCYAVLVGGSGTWDGDNYLVASSFAILSLLFEVYITRR